MLSTNPYAPAPTLAAAGSTPATTSAASTPQFGGTADRSRTFASDTLGALTRAQYADYLSRFVPFENEQIAYATDQARPDKDAQAAIKTVDTAFDGIAGQTTRRNERLGLTASPEQMAAIQRNTNLQKGLAEVTGANRAAQQTYDRQNQIFAGTGAVIPTQRQQTP